MRAVALGGGRVLRMGRPTYTPPDDDAPVEGISIAAGGEFEPSLPLCPAVVPLPFGTVPAVVAAPQRLEG